MDLVWLQCVHRVSLLIHVCIDSVTDVREFKIPNVQCMHSCSVLKTQKQAKVCAKHVA